MKKLVTLFDIQSIQSLSQYADGFIVGQDQVSTRITRSFSSDDIIKASLLAKSLGKSFYIMMNRMLHNKDAHHYETFINEVDSDAITGYMIGDIGIASILKSKGIESKAVYNPETLLANQYDVFYYKELNFDGVFLAKEITLEDIIEIGQNRPYHLYMYIHGYLNMFYSKRQLIEAYFENQGVKNLYHNKRDLKVVEEKRPDFVYKALEDEAGTHIFREHVLCGLDYLDDLKNSVDYIVFDTIFHDDQYALDVLKYYETKDEAIKTHLMDTYQEPWDHGFLFKKTVYKPKKVTK